MKILKSKNKTRCVLYCMVKYNILLYVIVINKFFTCKFSAEILNIFTWISP